MKIIDLLNKIAKGEITELHKFKWDERIWEEYSKFEEINNEKSYQEHRQNGASFMRFGNICDARCFNDEVKIIEEKQDIEHYDYCDNPDVMTPSVIANNFRRLNEDLDNIAKLVNELKKNEI